jgi:hypothetical protein
MHTRRLGIGLISAVLATLAGIGSCFPIEIAYEPNWPQNWQDQLDITSKPVQGRKTRALCESWVKDFEKTYARDGLDRWLKKIVLLESFSMSGRSFQATYDSVHLVIWSVCKPKYSSEFAKNLHHEFSSLLLYNNEDAFNIDEWQSYNKQGSAAYLYSEDERWYALDTPISMDLNPALYDEGFLTEYSKASVEEDINMFAEYIFTSPEQLTKISRKYTAIHKKIDHLKRFYQTLGLLDPGTN